MMLSFLYESFQLKKFVYFNCVLQFRNLKKLSA